jgi:hypothetical protein
MQTHIVFRVAGVAHWPLQARKKCVVVVINAIFLSSERKRVMWTPVRMARFGGLVGVLAGVLSIAHGLFVILLRPHYWAASSFSDYLSIALTSIGLLLLVGALVGLHARQTGRCGKMERLEKISFFLAALGATVAAVSNVAEDGFHIPLMGGVFIASIFILLLGLLLLAIATLLANVLPRWYGWTLLVGSLGLLLNDHLLPDGGGIIVFGLTWIVLGYALWKDPGAGAIEPVESGGTHVLAWLPYTRSERADRLVVTASQVSQEEE